MTVAFKKASFPVRTSGPIESKLQLPFVVTSHSVALRLSLPHQPFGDCESFLSVACFQCHRWLNIGV